MSDELLRLVDALPPSRRKLLADLLQPTREPVAIVGIGCRFPGNVHSPDDYWDLLRSGRDAIGDVPDDRWDNAEYYDPDPAIRGKTNSRWGGFLERIDHFDPGFFGISPREAISMDPQQRLTLEVAWQALEDAGQTPAQLAALSCGVFMGVVGSEYAWLQPRAPELIDAYTGTGIAGNMVSGRLAYALDLKGPNMAIDTGCSSGLLAVHHACRSLWADDCEVALAGGVNAVLTPWLSILATRMGATAPDGRCKTFDPAADGYVRGEGCGIVVLKLLSRARADGDRIYAALRGSATNHDGRSSSLTAPNPAAQIRVIREALKSARLRPAQLGFLEAHGTGTALGDQIELEAIQSVLGADAKDRARPCFVGSVKTNLGHLEAAAGLAGLIKSALALFHQSIPPNLHFTDRNAAIDRELVQVPTEYVDWKRGAAARYAGVSSFGWSGTNVHVVLEEAPESAASLPPTAADRADALPYFLPASAHTVPALHELLERLSVRLEAAADLQSVAELCNSMAHRRAHHVQRAGLVGASAHELCERIAEQLELPREPRRDAAAGPIVFVFSGHGSQWPRMGQGLFESEPVYRNTLLECERALSELVDWSLLEVLAASDGSLLSARDRLDVSQVAVCAVQIALAATWQSYGIQPAAVVGHSMGEVAAAHVAGILSLRDALRVIVERSALLESTCGAGGMLVASLAPSRAEAYLSERRGDAWIACVNSPRTLVISGQRPAIQRLVSQLAVDGVWHKELAVVGAGHGPQVDPILAPLAAKLESLRPQPGRVPFYSTVTGNLLPGASIGADYWPRNLRQPVLFGSAIGELLKRHRLFVEVSPAPLLANSIAECAADLGKPSSSVPSLRRSIADRTALRAGLAALYAEGAELAWSQLVGPRGRMVSFPALPWQHGSYWNAVEHGEVAEPSIRLLPREPSDAAAHYEISWLPFELAKQAPEPDVHWLVFADGGGFAAAAVNELAARGASWTLVRRGASFREHARDDIELDPSRESDLQQLMAAVRNRPGELRVLHFASLDLDRDAPAASPSAADTAEAIGGACMQLVRLFRTLGAQARFCVITRGAEAVSAAEPISAPQAAVRGLLRVPRFEYPQSPILRVDLGAAAAPHPTQPTRLEPNAAGAEYAEVAALLDVCERASAEEELALRRGQLYVRRLRRAHTVARREAFTLSGSCLVTGGLGGLGLRLAEWLAAHGARHVVLVGRRAPTAPQLERLAAWTRAYGTRFTPLATDIASASDMSSLTQHLLSLAEGPWSIFHLAGLTRDALIAELDDDSFRSVMAAKICGTLQLEEIADRLPTRHFVLFSSLASVLGSPGQANYCAANAFVDARAHSRAAAGRHALSLAWGPWSDVGGAVEQTARLERFGVRSLSPAEALAALETALQEASVQRCIAHLSPSRLRESQLGAQGWLLLDGLAEPPAAGPHAPNSLALQSQRRTQLLAADAEARPQLLTAFLRESIAQILRRRLDEIDTERNLFALGLDSLMALELKIRVEQLLPFKVEPGVLWEHPTIDALAHHFAARMSDDRAA